MYNNCIYYSQGFHTGSILAMLSGLRAACMRVDTCDLPASNSATSEKNHESLHCIRNLNTCFTV